MLHRIRHIVYIKINENYVKIYRTLRLLSCRKRADRRIAYLSLIKYGVYAVV